MPSVESRLGRLEQRELGDGCVEGWLELDDGRFMRAGGLVLTREELDARPVRPGVRTLRIVIERREAGAPGGAAPVAVNGPVQAQRGAA